MDGKAFDYECGTSFRSKTVEHALLISTLSCPALEEPNRLAT